MSGFNFDVITLFPKAFELINNLGVITRALENNLIIKVGLCDSLPLSVDTEEDLVKVSKEMN